jgi:hypothetical protein
MGVCVLNVSGLNFRVGEFLKESPFKPSSVYHRGDIPKCKNPERIPRPDSGFVILINEDQVVDTVEQIKAARRFLNDFATELQRAKEFGADDLRMDFAQLRGRGVQESQYFPPDFLFLTGKMGIGIEASSVQLATG